MIHDENLIKEIARACAENDWAWFSDEEWNRLWHGKVGPSITESEWRPVMQAVAVLKAIQRKYDIVMKGPA